jgi:tetratricopeptide (TPR) repeat protein
VNSPSRAALSGSVVFLILSGLYLRGAAPTITSGDAAELSAAALTLGNAHSPGYPLFVLLGRLFANAVPFANPAYQMNLFSGFCTAAAVVIGGFAWRAFDRFPSTLALLLVGAAPLLRRLAVSTEVFGLNIFMAAACALGLTWAGRAAGAEAARRLFVVFLVFGLGLTNQQTMLLLVPAGALWLLFYRERWRAFAAKIILGGTLCALAGLALYGYLYVRSRQEPLLDWEDPETFSRLWKVVTRARYGTLQLAQGTPPGQGWARIGSYADFWGETVLSCVTWAGIPLLFVGLAGTVRGGRLKFVDGKDFRASAVYLTAVAVSGPLFLLWASVTPTDSTKDMLARFLVLPVFLGFYFAVRGVRVLWERGSVACRGAALAGLGLWTVLLFPAEAESMRGNFITRDHGRNVLRCLPDRAVLFSDRADETEFALAYLLYVENARPDADFIDANAGVTKSAYGNDYYEIWGKPRLAIRERKEREFLAQTDRPVFYATLDVAQINLPRRAAGILYEANLQNNFSSRTRFPYWETFLWRFPDPSGNRRDRHLVISDLGLLGDYALMVEAPSAAEKLYGRALGYGYTPGMMKLANWLRSNRRYDESEQLYRRLMKYDDLEASAWNNLGVLYADREKWQEALESYRRSLKLDPTNAMAHYNIGVVHWRIGQWAEAAEAFGKTARLDPHHPAAARFAEEARRRAER